MTRALAAACLALALLPATASAHALLEATSPERGARLERVPEQVSLRFSEPVEAEFGSVRVFDARGREVQDGRVFHPGGRGAEVAVRLRDGLSDDGYTVTYRVISADSHPVSGGFVFVAGDGTAPATTVADLLGEDRAGPVTRWAFAGVRAVQFGAIAAGLGALVFVLACWLPGLRAVAGGGSAWAGASAAFARRARALVLAAAGAGVLSGVLAIVLQGAVASGTPVWDALSAGVVSDVLGTRFGLWWGLGVILWLVTAALALPGPVPALRPVSVGATGLALPGSAGVVAPAVPLVALACLPALGGHAGVQSPVAVLLPANVLHVAAMSAWLGGIAMLVFTLRAATARLVPGDRTRLLTAVVGRFSALAGIAIAVLLASGIVQSVVEVRTPANLVETPFGRAVLVKVVLFAAIVALGWVNRRRLLPALADATGDPRRAGVLLRRTLRAELLIGVAALAVTGALAGYAPSIAEGTAPFSGSADIGPARLELTVDPARVGPNELHVYLFDRASGRQYDATKELTVTAELPERADRADRARAPQGRPRPLRDLGRSPGRGRRLDARDRRPRLGVRRAPHRDRGTGQLADGGGPDRGQQRLDGGPLGVRRAGRHEDGPVHGALGDRPHGDARMRLRTHELGQQRHGLARSDEGQARNAVVGPVAQVGIEAAELAADAVRDLLPAGPAMAGRPALVRELVQRHRAGVAPRDRMVRGQHDADRVVAEVLAGHARGPRQRLVLPFVGQHEVDVAECKRRQRLLGLGLDQLAAQRRCVAREGLHGRHGETQRDRLEGGDSAPPRDPPRRGGQLGLCELGPLEQRRRVADQDERGVGEADAAAGRLEQRHARLALEHRELLGDGRGRELQRVGDRGDRPPRVQLVEQAQPAEIEH